MKKSTILNFVESGLINMTTNTLSTSSAYKVYKLKREIDKWYKDIFDEKLSLISSVFGENYEADIDEYNRLYGIGVANLTGDELTRFEDLNEKNRKSVALINEMGKDEVTLSNIQPISYEDWNALKQENKASIPFVFEMALEGIFWLPLKENDF